jgi:hypothetical protein
MKLLKHPKSQEKSRYFEKIYFLKTAQHPPNLCVYSNASGRDNTDSTAEDLPQGEAP